MKAWIAILTFFILIDMEAQPKRIYFQIDTITSNLKVEDLFYFGITVGKEGFLNLGVSFDSTAALKLNQFPNFSNPIQLAHDSSTIEIPINLTGSHIVLKNAYKIKSDSLIIDHWQVYPPQPIDTFHTILVYFKKINGELAEKPYKAKIISKVRKVKSLPARLRIRINGIFYIADLKRGSETVITHGHGYKPRKYLKRNGDYKRRLKYIYSDSRSKTTIWTGKIDLLKIDDN